MVVTKYTLMKDGSFRAPFETEEEVVRYRISNQDKINEYHAERNMFTQTNARSPANMLSALGAMLLGDESENTKMTDLAKSLIDTQEVKLMRAAFS